MMLEPNNDWEQKKGEKSSIERKSEKILAQANEETKTIGFLLRRTVKTVIYNDNAKRNSPGSWVELSVHIENQKIFPRIYSTKQIAFEEALLMAQEDRKKENINITNTGYANGTITLERFVREGPGSNGVENSRDITYWIIEYEIIEMQETN